MVGTADSVLIREVSRGLYGEVPQYYIYEHEAIQKTISENNIRAPWAPQKVTAQSLDPVSTLRNNCKVTVD